MTVGAWAAMPGVVVRLALWPQSAAELNPENHVQVTVATCASSFPGTGGWELGYLKKQDSGEAGKSRRAD